MFRTLALLFAALVLAGSGSAATGRLPTKVIAAKVRAAVRTARAHVLHLRIVRRRVFSLSVGVRDPARFLKHRFPRLVRVVNRYTGGAHYHAYSQYLAVRERPSKRLAFWISTTSEGGGSTTIRWNVRPRLTNCLQGIDLPIEVDPDGAAPPCPVS